MTGNREDRASQGRVSCYKGGMMKKTAAIVTGLLLSVFMCSSMAYAATDAPHNEARGISCGSCHDANPGAFNSPFWDPAALDTEYNVLCNSCHLVGATTGTDLYVGTDAPQVATHSSATTSTAHGTWSVLCIDCHEPHAHDQKMWHKTDGSQLFLATGKVTGMAPGAAYHGDATTVYTYSSINYKAGWDAASLLNKTTDERRPLFFPAAVYLAATYPVIDITATTITVQGDTTPLYGGRGFIQSDFAIEYGQAIKRYISGTFNGTTLTNKEVKFFDKSGEGSFAYNDGLSAGGDFNVNGICQVCHTQTIHFKNDGTITTPSDTGTHIGRDGGNCIACHLHSAGFAGGADHTPWVTNTGTTSCTTTCHTVNSSPFTGPSEPHNLNGCATCHVGTPKLAANGGLFVATIDAILPADGANGCGECHAAHVADWFTHEVAHDTRAAGVAPCTDCHTGTGGNVTTMPTSSADDTIHDACTTCHQADGSLNGGTTAYGGQPLAIGDCATCHTAAYFDLHVHGTDAGYVSHTVALDTAVDRSQNLDDPSTSCEKCHTPASTLATWNGVKEEHSSACDTCHDYATNGNVTGDPDTPSLATVQATITAGAATSCVTCHVPKDHASGASSTHGGHPVDFGKDGACTGCHTGADVLVDIHGDGASSTCSICHAGSPSATTEKVGDALNGVDGDATIADGTAASSNWAAVTCLTCHPIATYDASTVHHTSANGYAAAGNCVQCHTGANYPGDHTNRVQDTANCNTCHTATAGDATGVPVDPAVNATANKVHDACTTCHNTDDNATLKAAYGKATAMPAGTAASNDGGGDCNACHSAYFVNHINANHTARVQDTANCNTCHTATAGTATTVPVSTGNNQQHDSCASCHNTTTGALLGVTAPGGAGAIAAGDCNNCHGAYFVSHSNANHISRVGLHANCSSCHTGTEGTATTVPLSTGSDKVHDTCSVCHNVTTGAVSGTTIYGGQALAVGDCGTCHTAAYFDSHIHGTGTNHDVAYVSGTDISQVSSPAPCASCHTDNSDAAGTPLDSWTDILGEHLGACATCHSYVDGGDATPTELEVSNAIAGTGNTCTTCHVKKLSPAATSDHGGHPADAFTFDSNCADCHGAGLGAEDIVSVIHGGTCTVCHAASPNRDNEKVGDATNGVDGDATQANGTALAAEADINQWNTPTCTTCHNTTTYDVSTVHHTSANGYAAAGDCVQCHNTATQNNSHAGDHILLVEDTLNNCNTCHDATVGTADNVPVDPAVNATANKVHDACTTCHNTDADGTLKAAYGKASAMPAGTAASNDGGGECTDCHGAYFASHVQPNHSVHVADTTNCNTCHTATAGTTTTIPTSTINGKVHDGCATCHNVTNGALLDKATANINGYVLGAAMAAGDCNTCHASYFDSHGNASHTARVAAGATGCDSCHTATAGTGTTVPVSTGDAKQHDSCATCHNLTNGALLDKATANINGYVLGASMAAGDCGTCHSTYFDSHVQPDHSVHVADTTNCNTCHTATAGTATSIPTSNANGKVHDACTTCHAANGALLDKATANINGYVLGAAMAAGNCNTCHASYFDSHGNASHTARVADTANCNTCHTTTAGTATTVPVSSGNGKEHDSCATCHNLTNGALLDKATANVNGYVLGASIAAGDCNTCHASYFDSHGNASHTARVAAGATGCDSCHTATAGTGTTVPVSTGDAKQHDSCATCHNLTNGALLDKATANINGYVLGASMAAGDCGTCHSTYFDSHVQPDHSVHVADTTNCNTCHTATAGTATSIPTSNANGKVHDTCTTCHAANGALLDKATANINGYVLGAAMAAGNCNTCHASYFDSHGNASHTARVADTANCNTCHTTTAGTATTVPVSSGNGKEHDSCATCHNLTNGALLDKATANVNGYVLGAAMAAGDCNTCHASYFDSHGNASHTARVADTANCNTCHTATAGTATTVPVSSGNGKEHDSCATCHNLTNGALLDKATANVNGYVLGAAMAAGDCNTCHASYFDSHGNASHTARVAAGATGCDSCHAATAGTATTVPVSTGDPQVHDLCSTCHNLTNGALLDKATANINGYVLGAAMAAGDCGTCHSTYFDSHVHGTDAGYVSHVVTFSEPVDRSQNDDIAANACDQCHTPASTLASWNGIKEEHSSACNTCHDYATNGNVTGDPGTPSLATVESTITAGAATTCITCHVPKDHASGASSVHGGHAADFGKDVQCTGCHTGADVFADIHSSNCALCHTGGVGGRDTNMAGVNGDGDAGPTTAAEGIAIASAWATTTCVTCHTPANAGVTATTYGGIHHNLADGAFGSNCTTSCHSAATTGFVSNAHDARIVGEANCNSCHTGIAGTSTTAPTSQANGTIHDTCVTCHTINASPDYAAVLATPAAGRGLDGTQLPAGGGGCATACHTVSPFKDYHHASDNAQGGNCILCHNQSLVGATAPAQMACRECHVDETQNGIAVLSYRLSLGDGTQPTSMVNKSDAAAGTDANGYVTSHAITGGSPIAIANYEACMDCHSRGNTPIDAQGGLAAPVIAPFHGFPGDAASGYIETGMGLYTNKTFIGTGSSYTGLDEVTNTNNANSLPLAFMYYHPGHISFRRFGETATMTRRSGANGYGDNGQLYRNNGNYANAIRGNSYVAATVEDYVRKAGNTWAGGECTHGGGNNFNTGTNLDIACLERKTGAGLDHETPVTGYADRINIPYTNFGTSLGNLTNVPYFINVVTPVLPDNVFVNSAEVDINGDLQVSAGNDDGCAALSVHPDGGASIGNMGGTSPNCTFTSFGINPIPTTVDVRTTNAQGVDVTGYPVTDNSNAVPVAVNDIINVSVETVYNGDVTANNGNGADTGLADTPLTFTLVTDVPGGEGTLNLNTTTGTFSYDPGASFTGSTSFQYSITDVTPDSSGTATVSITVSNNVPVAVGDTFATGPGVSITGGDLTANDTAGDGASTYNLAVGASAGSLTWHGDGTFDFDPLALTDGQSATFEYTITDAKPSATPDTSNQVVVTINVSANAVPVAVDDAFTLSHTAAITNLTVLLANPTTQDSDGDGDPLTVNAVNTTGTNGTVAINVNNTSIDYTPSGTFAGVDTFTYTITDGAATSNTATVSVTVTNTAPTAVNDAFSVTQDTTNNALAVMAANPTTADSDADGDTIALSTVVSPTTQGGTATISGTNILYTPAAAFTGTDTFTYTINDGFVDSASATVTVTVDAAGMTGDGGDVVAGIMPGDNFAVNGSTTIDFTFAAAVDGVGGNSWTLMTYDGTVVGNCTGTFTGSGTTWSGTIDFAGCDGGADPAAGLYMLEIDLRDNNTGGIRVRAMPITLGATAEYQKTFSDAGYSVETTSFGYQDMVYIEIQSASFSGCDLASKDEVGLDSWDGNIKYLDKEPWTSCSDLGGGLYQLSFDLTNQAVAFPSGTFWYPGRGRANGNDDIGLMLEITAP